MTDVTFRCIHCNQSLAAPAERTGEIIDCPKCHGRVAIGNQRYWRQSQPTSRDPHRARATRRYFAIFVIGYLFIGLVLTFTPGGCFSGEVTQAIVEMNSPHLEFLKVKGRVTTIGSLADVPDQPYLDDHQTVIVDGLLVQDALNQPKELWIKPFGTANDTLCIHIASESTATIEYLSQGNATPPAHARPTRLLFVDEGVPHLRTNIEMKALTKPQQFSFLLCPAEPMEHNKTITVYGFGAWSHYAAKVTNPGDFPYIYRNHRNTVRKGLNYLWAGPLDVLTMPIFYPAFQIWWNVFLRF